MSDRPVPAGEPGQTPGWPPQELPGGVAGQGQTVPDQPMPGQIPVPAQPMPGQPMLPPPAWQQGGFPPPVQAVPDWEALAASNEQAERRRKTVRLAVGGVVGALVLGAVVVAAVVVTRKGGDDPVVNPTTTASAGASGSAKSPAAGASGTPKGIAGPPTTGSLPATKGAVPLGLGSDAKAGTVNGYSGQVLKLASGQNSFGQSGKQLVDPNQSFTVSARVLVDAPQGNRSAVSQGDGPYYSYSLGRTNSGGRNLWYFKVQLPGGGTAVVLSKGDAPVDQWALLTGVYDDKTNQITLYVNGAPQGSAQAGGVQPSGTGALQIGRLSSNGQWADPWRGAVADVQLWDQVVPESDIVKLVAGASSPPATPPVAAWLTG